MPELINGQKIAQGILTELKKKIKLLNQKLGLAVILVGDEKASKLYVSLKEKACQATGIHFVKYCFPQKATESAIIKKIQELNKDKKTHGILVQLPLPEHLNENKIIETIDPDKDVEIGRASCRERV